MSDSNDSQFYYDLLRAFVDSANDAIFVLCDEMKFLTCNKTMQTWIGYTEQSLTAHKQRIPITELLGCDEGVAQFTAAFERALKGESSQFDVFIKPPKSDARWIELNMKRVEIDVGDMIIVVARDISERKRAEEESVRMQHELAQSQKIQTLGELTGGIAHDFNNILNIITGYAELSISEYETTDGNISLKNIEQIRLASERAKELISQLMVFSRNNDNKPVNLFVEENITDTLGLLRATIPSSIRLNFEEKNNQAKINIDPVRLQQLLLNICVNSRDAITGEGYINVTVDQFKNENSICSCCKNEITGSWINISIEDSGHGMDDATSEKIFDPFFTTKSVGHGTGLGLSMVRRIMEDCNGHILLTTKQNSGTTVSLLFPPAEISKVEVEAEAALSVIKRPINEKTYTIMVVDDEVQLVEMLNEILTMNGYRCMAYSSSVEALANYRSTADDIDLVITDQTMPSISGIELINNIYKVKPDQKIILVTGYSDQINLDIVNELGVTFMHKPVRPSDLLASIQKIMS